MSLRLWISACSFEKIEGVFGSKDANQLKKLEAFAEKHLSNDAESLSKTKELLSNLINHKKSKHAKPESGEEIAAAYALASVNSTNPWEEEGEQEWAWGDVDQVYRECGTRFGDQASLLELLVGGRNMFGQGFDDEAGWYTYLRHDEVAELNARMYEVLEQCAEIIDSGAMNEQDFDSSVVGIMECLSETLTTVEESGDDIFVYAS